MDNRISLSFITPRRPGTNAEDIEGGTRSGRQILFNDVEPNAILGMESRTGDSAMQVERGGLAAGVAGSAWRGSCIGAPAVYAQFEVHWPS